MTPPPRCENCRWAILTGGYGAIECRRNPPTAVLDPLTIPKGRFPIVRPSDWCGEFQAKEGGEQ